jgi:hypothetical protein|tara:strand:+ start:504 stop:707 length:204 start_codon:yes stop_codon:yes gene_type:complete
MATKKKRARTGKGTYRGDDPSTPNKNEAWLEESAKKKAPVKKRPSPFSVPPWSAAYKAMVLRGEIKS